MKLRLRGSSVRLRLTRAEVAAVGRGESVVEAVDFGGGERLVYALECGGDRVTASFHAGRVSLRVPMSVAAEWSTSEQVGITSDDAGAPGSPLRVLIEKDFACLTARAGEDESDAFPNPNESCGPDLTRKHP